MKIFMLIMNKPENKVAEKADEITEMVNIY